MPVAFPVRTLALATAASLVAAVPARAQLAMDVSGGIDFANGYVDRGVILSTQPIFQPHFGVALPVGTSGGAIGIGVMATLEPIALDSTRYFGMAPGAKSPNLAEVRPALTLSQSFSLVRFSFGVAGRVYPGKAGITKSGNVLSVQSSVGLRTPLTPRLTFSYDAGGINGAYFEGEVRQGIRFAKGAALVLGGRAGWAVRQTAESTVVAFAPYTRDGFTHLELTAGARLTVAGAELEPYVAWTRVPDPYVAASGPSRQRARYFWVGTKLGLSGRFPKARPADKAPAAR
jgi:hypothetical protein